MEIDPTVNTLPLSKEKSPILKKDIIAEFKPEKAKLDILYFKEEVLQEIKQLEKNLIQKSKEANDMLKEKISIFDIKLNFIKDNINSLSTKVLDGLKNQEKLDTLYQSKDRLINDTSTNKIKISLLEKETRDNINRINDLLKQSILYPGIIGNRGKFKTFHEFIDFVLTESNNNSNYRYKNIMELNSFKLKIDKSIQTFSFQIQSNLLNANNFTERKLKEANDNFDETFRRYRTTLEEIKIENSKYVIQLEKNIKDLRKETNLIKNIRNDIFSKIDNEVNNMKIENEKLKELLKGYKEDNDIMRNDIINIEKRIEELMIEKIGILFDNHKKVNKAIDEFKKTYNDNKKDFELRINDIKNNAKEEQIILVNSIKDINNKLNIICKNTVDNNNLNTEIENNNNNANRNNITKNNNINSMNQEITNNARMQGKVEKFSRKKNINIRNFKNENENIFHTVNINRIGFIANKGKAEVEKDINILDNNSNNNLIKPNDIYGTDVFLNKKILENLKISKIHRLSKVPINSQNNLNINKYRKDVNINIGENILSESKNDYILSAKNKKIYNNNKNIFSSSLRCKSTLRQKNKVKTEEVKDIEYDNYRNSILLKKNKKIKRNSFNIEKIKTLEKFQKLLKLNINDVNAKLNNFNNISTTSFKILNENKEIYDRFFLSNLKDEIQFSDKYLHTKDMNTNTQSNNRNNNMNLLNIYSNGNSSDKNSNDEYLSTKNFGELKTSNYFYHFVPNKKVEKNFKIRPDSQNLIKFKRYNIFSPKIKTNSEIANLKRGIKTKPLGTNSLTKLHNYFIGFFDDEFDRKKKRKKKIKYKSYSNTDKISEEKKDKNKNNAKQIKVIYLKKNK